MDVLGALALATAPPLPEVINEPAITAEVPIMQKVIWRQIYGISLWNIFVMALIIFFGRTMFDLEYQTSEQANASAPKRYH